ncbi:MAG: hypothetical protein IKU40_07760 [Clostridia bacterium]|nr:hypothetical protein [Clostridia bacterium]
MCNYHCPFAERKAVAGFLLCRDLYKEDVNYNVRENAMGVICAFQKQCMKTGKMENTDAAKECYKMRLALKESAPEPEFVTGTSAENEESIPAETKITAAASKGGKKKKG